jgi:hypothetical protein
VTGSGVAEFEMWCCGSATNCIARGVYSCGKTRQRNWNSRGALRFVSCVRSKRRFCPRQVQARETRQKQWQVHHDKLHRQMREIEPKFADVFTSALGLDETTALFEMFSSIGITDWLV